MKKRHRLAVLVCMLLLSSLVGQPALAGLQAFPLAQGNVSPCADQNTFLPMIWGSANNVQVAADPGDPSDDEGTPSAAIIVPRDLSLTSVNKLELPVAFDVSCAELATTPGNVTVLVNDRLLEKDAYRWLAHVLLVEYGIDLGPQRIRIVAEDVKGGIVNTEMELWFGADTLQVGVQDAGGQPVNGADVTVKMGDNQSISVTAKTENGVATFSNMPDRTVYLEAKAAPNRFASLATIGSAGSVTLILSDIGPASPIDNNDFSKGTDGWNIGSAPVQLVPHQETAASGASVAADDMDLVLNTSGEGPQSISRTFTVKKGAKHVTVRYRFITSEVPGGYFGTKYNDYFSVSIRSQSGGGFVSEANSMNGLGLGAFDAIGATQWRETSLPVNKEGDTIQVDVTVANVADDLLDSQVVVDLVKEPKLAITALTLRDIDNSNLAYLSAAAHTYFGGNTRVHGTITVEGAEDDALQSLELEVIQNGGVVARGNLAAGVKGTLIRAFGQAEKVEVTAPQLLFEIPSAQAAQVNGAQDGTVSLRVRAKSKNGEEATKEFGAVQILVRYTAAGRYGGRDEGVGGDDWVKPSVKPNVEHFGVTVGDISNMNGGAFAPHQTHRTGNDVDGWFAGYNNRDAATAATIIGHLNEAGYGPTITTVFVTYQQVNGNAFWTAIKDVVLNDGRNARDVIRPLGGHDTHFHWIITP